ncbi:MAG: response regulator transcription factor [Verrucomicrobiota bacterium]
MKAKILIVEDDPHILLGLEEVLKSEGFDVALCQRGDKAIEAVPRHRPELVILDVMLPGLSGYDVCRELRRRGVNLPILMLTAKGQEMDKVVGLELGADDYVTKPFGLRELLARIHALLRRAGPAGSGGKADEPFQVGGCLVDPKRLEVRRGKTVEAITGKELRLLVYFHAHAGEVLARDRLLRDVWGYQYGGTTRTLDQTIVQLRRKIGDSGGEPRYIVTVHGIGYKLAGNSL